MCVCAYVGWGGQKSEQMADIAAAHPPSTLSLLPLHPHDSSAGYGVGAINKQGGGLHPPTTHHPPSPKCACVCHRGPLHQAASLEKQICMHTYTHTTHCTSSCVHPSISDATDRWLKAVNQIPTSQSEKSNTFLWTDATSCVKKRPLIAILVIRR